MSAALKWDFVSVDDYLARELDSPVKHEFVAGIVYAMAGARNRHNAVASNALVALGFQLRGKECRAFNSDTKIRIRLPEGDRFYYPDASVICHQNPQRDTFQEHPKVIVEVISASTRRIDEGEKLESYQKIPSLAAYVLIEQDEAAAIVYRRGERGFGREVYTGLDATVPLPEIGISLPLREVYEGVTFGED